MPNKSPCEGNKDNERGLMRAGKFHVRLNTGMEKRTVSANASYNHKDGDAFTSRFPVISSNDPVLSLNLACKSRCLRATFISRASPPPRSWNITEMKRNSRTLFLSAVEQPTQPSSFRVCYFRAS